MTKTKLNNVILLKKGKKPKLLITKSDSNLKPYVDIKAFETGVIDNYTDGDKCVECQDGDLLIVCDGSRSGLVGRALNGYIGSTLARIDVDKCLDKEYLYYFIQSKYYQLNTSVKGTGTPHLNQELLKSFDIFIPPIEEQRRIVSRIEELFSELDSAVETLQKTRQQLEIYRQAVLKEAFEGISECVTMDTVATMIDPQPSHRTPPVHQGGIPYIGIGDIDYKNYSIIFSEARKVNPNLLDEHKQRYSIDDGDFIMGKIGTIGKPFKLPLPQNYTLSANVILIKPHIKIINPDFLFWQFSSDWVTTQLMSGATATSQPAFGIKKARLLRIKICDYDAQIEIVNSINSKMSECDNINKTVAKSLQQAEAMRQSILKKAFEGEF